MEAEHLNLNLQLGPHWSTGVFCAVQSHDIAFHIAEYKHQSIEVGDHWNADVLHRSTVVCGGIVIDHCSKQIVVLVDNLQIGGTRD